MKTQDTKSEDSASLRDELLGAQAAASIVASESLAALTRAVASLRGLLGQGRVSDLDTQRLNDAATDARESIGTLKQAFHMVELHSRLTVLDADTGEQGES